MQFGGRGVRDPRGWKSLEAFVPLPEVYDGRQVHNRLKRVSSVRLDPLGYLTNSPVDLPGPSRVELGDTLDQIAACVATLEVRSGESCLLHVAEGDTTQQNQFQGCVPVWAQCQ